MFDTFDVYMGSTWTMLRKVFELCIDDARKSTVSYKMPRHATQKQTVGINMSFFFAFFFTHQLCAFPFFSALGRII